MDAQPSELHEELLADFSLPWCQQLLNDPAYEHFEIGTRVSETVNGASYNTLMGKTLHTDSTTRAMQYLYKPKDPNDNRAIAGEVIALVSIGNGMCSHGDVLHGGINATLVDEIGGALAMKEAPPGTSMMAVNFNVNLRKSVRAPSVIMGRAWIEKKPEVGQRACCHGTGPG